VLAWQLVNKRFSCKEDDAMAYLERIRTAHSDPEQLEQTYRNALQDGEDVAFTGAIEELYTESPGNLLFGAWHFRLRDNPDHVVARTISWLAALAFAAANGLLFWWFSSEHYQIVLRSGSNLPLLLLIWAPLSAICVMALLVYSGAGRRALALALALLLMSVAIYPLWAHTLISDATLEQHYLEQMLPHLSLLAWATVGIFVLRGRGDSVNRFTFLIKSLEIFIMAGLFAIAGVIFTSITAGLFAALAIQLPDSVMRMIVAGGAGLIPVLAVAVIYNPAAAPAEQSFRDGLSKVIATLMRILLPLTLAVLVIYLGFIPFRFWEPFQNRDVLIIYNAMLFAVIALLVGATPIQPQTLPHQMRIWLRRGLIVVALLATVISLYALAAIGYRTWEGGITLNRLTIIGWNVINIGILTLLLVRQQRATAQTWTSAMQSAFGAGMPIYAAWALFVVLALPWLFA
jgi:hypothetical protein